MSPEQNKPRQRRKIEKVSFKMALQRQKNNIVNLAFGIMNEDGKAGISLDQSIVNGRCAGCSVRVVNGGRKSAAVRLDREALQDLAEALTEVLATDGEF